MLISKMIWLQTSSHLGYKERASLCACGFKTGGLNECLIQDICWGFIELKAASYRQEEICFYNQAGMSKGKATKALVKKTI